MGNIDINQIRKKGFEKGSMSEKIEAYCRVTASQNTDKLLEKYKRLEPSRNGKYINSDLMKMVYPFYARRMDNRRLYNMSITNTAAVLTNEAYLRAIKDDDVKRCIFIVGPYGAGKSYFTQSLFENDKDGMLDDSIVYEGSITPPAFEEKLIYAMENGVVPNIVALNPTLELSMRNIKSRAKEIGRDVEKKEVIDKFSNFYRYMKDIVDKHGEIPYIIYTKESNKAIDLKNGSTDLEELNHGSEEFIIQEYDRIKEMLNNEEMEQENIR